MPKVFSGVVWFLIAVVGAGAFGALALKRGEHVNSIYILTAALCTYAIGYRFYSKWIAAQALALNDRRATPCEVRDDGKDFVKTNKWIVFGHHFAAISGPGPLVGPVLAEVGLIAVARQVPLRRGRAVEPIFGATSSRDKRLE